MISTLQALCHLFFTVWLLVSLTVNFTHSNKLLWWGMKADKSVRMWQIFRRQLNNNVHLQDDNKSFFFRIFDLCLEPQDPGQVIIQVTNLSFYEEHKSNQRAVVYLQDIHATISSMLPFNRMNCYYHSQGSQLCNIFLSWQPG